MNEIKRMNLSIRFAPPFRFLDSFPISCHCLLFQILFSLFIGKNMQPVSISAVKSSQLEYEMHIQIQNNNFNSTFRRYTIEIIILNRISFASHFIYTRTVSSFVAWSLCSTFVNSICCAASVYRLFPFNMKYNELQIQPIKLFKFSFLSF